MLHFPVLARHYLGCRWPVWPLYGPFFGLASGDGPFGPFVAPLRNTYVVPFPVVPTLSRTPFCIKSERSRCAVLFATSKSAWYSLLAILPVVFKRVIACCWRSLSPNDAMISAVSQSRQSVMTKEPLRCSNCGSGNPASRQSSIMRCVPDPAFSM